MNPRGLLLGAGALLLCGNQALADELHEGTSLADTIGISGSLRAGHWSSSMNFDQRKDLGAGALWLTAAPRLADNVSAKFDGWTMGDHNQSASKHYNRVREGYINLNAGNTDFRLGKQIVTWGRADKLNPTNNLTPRDYTLLAVEDEDQRSGGYAAKATYNFSDWSLTGIWLPQFRPNALPLPSLPGVNFREHLEQRQGAALKVEQTGNAVDWSLSYYSGPDLNPDIGIDSVGGSGVNLRLDHHRMRVLGADAATVVGRYALRAEAAYTSTADSDGTDPLLKNSMFHLVAGGDRTFFEYLNINLQYYARYVQQFIDPSTIGDVVTRSIATREALLSNQYARFQHGVTFRISDKWMNETLEGEISGITSFTRRDYVLKPKLAYSFSDSWKGSLGANLFRGEQNSYYGPLKNISNVFTELKYGF
ncbi:MAG: DUF1302 family protein [Gallionella sp.]